MITLLWRQKATHGGLALFQNANYLLPESDLTMVEKKKVCRGYFFGSFCFILPKFHLFRVF
jgi:hypothetical protein